MKKYLLLSSLLIFKLSFSEKIILKNRSGANIFYIYVCALPNHYGASDYIVLENEKEITIDTDIERLSDLPIKMINIFSEKPNDIKSVFLKTYSRLSIDTKFYWGYEVNHEGFKPRNKEANDGVREFIVIKDSLNNLKFQENCCCVIL